MAPTNFRAPRTVQTNDQTLSLIQDALASLVNDLGKVPFINGNLLKSIQVKAGSNSIPHGLGRKTLGYCVVRTHNTSLPQPIITDNQDANPYPDKTLMVISSDPGAIDLWVF